MTATLQRVTSPRGSPVGIFCRDDTTDLSTVGSTFGLWGKPSPDEYRLATYRPSGYALDIGAHIGSVAFALLADNPDLTVIAVEPLFENCELIEATAEYNGWSGRIRVIRAAVAAGTTADIGYGWTGTASNELHRYIGNLNTGQAAHTTATVPALSLGALVDMAEGWVDLVKTDCEGCEWALLDSTAVEQCGTILGEWHGLRGPERLADLLLPTHRLSTVPHDDGTGLFWAALR